MEDVFGCFAIMSTCPFGLEMDQINSLLCAMEWKYQYLSGSFFIGGHFQAAKIIKPSTTHTH